MLSFVFFLFTEIQVHNIFFLKEIIFLRKQNIVSMFAKTITFAYLLIIC